MSYMSSGFNQSQPKLKLICNRYFWLVFIDLKVKELARESKF